MDRPVAVRLSPPGTAGHRRAPPGTAGHDRHGPLVGARQPGDGPAQPRRQRRPTGTGRHGLLPARTAPDLLAPSGRQRQSRAAVPGRILGQGSLGRQCRAAV